MNQRGKRNNRSSLPKGYVAARRGWQKIRRGLLDIVAVGNGYKRVGFIILLLAIFFFLLISLLSLLFVFQPKPFLIYCAWLVFGLLCVWIGCRLEYILHPERRAYQQVLEKYSRVIREISDQEILLDRITDTLYKTLRLESLSVWRYHDRDSILALARFEGAIATHNLAELPVDIELKQLHGTWPVSALPESALCQGLISMGVRVITSLSLGDQLIGLIGLGNSRFDALYSQETLRWLGLMTGQLALAVKNVYLITDLEETLNKLQLAYRRTIDTEEEERRHLAVELHDDILCRLTTMALTLRNSRNHLATDPAQVQAWLDMLEKETQYVNRRLREITQGLHPSVLTDLGLIAALRAYMDSLARQPLPPSAPRTITLTAEGFNGDRFAEQKLERDMYNIARQALDNAIAHAQAEQVFIHLRWREDAVSITVRDTGCGMADSPESLMGRNGCLGLLSMHERTLAWQGRLTFHAASGQGTTVHVYIPVDQPSSAPTHLQSFAHYLARSTPA